MNFEFLIFDYLANQISARPRVADFGIQIQIKVLRQSNRAQQEIIPVPLGIPVPGSLSDTHSAKYGRCSINRLICGHPKRFTGRQQASHETNAGISDCLHDPGKFVRWYPVQMLFHNPSLSACGVVSRALRAAQIWPSSVSI